MSIKLLKELNLGSVQSVPGQGPQCELCRETKVRTNLQSTGRKRIIIRTFYNPIISMLDFKELLSIPTEVHFQRFSNSKDTYLIRASKDIQNSIVRPDNCKFLNDFLPLCIVK